MQRDELISQLEIGEAANKTHQEYGVHILSHSILLLYNSELLKNCGYINGNMMAPELWKVQKNIINKTSH